jgi:hypothetical protein
MLKIIMMDASRRGNFALFTYLVSTLARHQQWEARKPL